MIFSKIRKKFGWYNLRKEAIKWVEKNLGKDYVDDFLKKYDALNNGAPIGGIYETIAFINLIEKIKKEV